MKKKLTMRKYQQLLLVIISTVSICLVLVYRHEYLRLRYVLEVLNFFGTPPKREDFLRRLNQNHPNWGPEPVWQRLDNNFYTFSAHRNLEKSANEIKILGMGLTSQPVPKFKCNFYFDRSESSLKNPQLGSFSYVKLSEGVNFSNYLFICKQKQVFAKRLHERIVPYGVSLGNSTIMFIKDATIIRNLEITLCNYPSNVQSTEEIIDFIAHNQVLGVEHFIFYNNFISGKLRQALDYFAVEINASFAVFPWNVPYNLEEELIRELVTHDCLFRTINTSKYIVMSRINQLIVPKHPSHLVTLLDTLENSRDAQRFAFRLVRFCKSFMPMKNILLNTRYVEGGEKREEIVVYRNREQKQEDNVEEVIRYVESEVAEIHEYGECGPKEKTKSDSSSMHYAAKLNDAQLKVMYDTKTLF